MKKAFLLLSLVLLVAIFELVACKKSDGRSEKGLSGTSWKMNRDTIVTLKFINNTDVDFLTKPPDQEETTVTGKYTYNNPNVRITDFESSAIEIDEANGVVSGNKMTLTIDFKYGQAEYSLTKE